MLTTIQKHHEIYNSAQNNLRKKCGILEEEQKREKKK